MTETTNDSDKRTDASLKIETWQTWAKRHNESCRTFSHWQDGFRYFRIRTRDRILLDHGFKCLPDTVTTNTNERDEDGKVVRLSPKQAVINVAVDYLGLYGVDSVEIVYMADTMDYGHFFVYRKLEGEKDER